MADELDLEVGKVAGNFRINGFLAHMQGAPAVGSLHPLPRTSTAKINTVAFSTRDQKYIKNSNEADAAQPRP